MPVQGTGSCWLTPSPLCSVISGRQWELEELEGWKWGEQARSQSKELKGFRCRVQPVLNGAAEPRDQWAARSHGARWQSCLWARPACSPSPGAAAFLQSPPLALSSCPPGEPFGMGAGASPGSLPAPSARVKQGGSRAGSAAPAAPAAPAACSRQGWGFPAPLTLHHPLLPLLVPMGHFCVTLSLCLGPVGGGCTWQLLRRD